MLEVKNMFVRYGNTLIVNDVSFSLKENQWLMLVGPNGAGKSTVVGAVSKLVPYDGEAFINGKDVKKTKNSEFARFAAVLSQYHYVSYAFTVREVVNLGRYSHADGFFAQKDDDRERKVDEALEMTGMSALADKSVLNLSGGELQRVFLAQIFAQDPKLLILDEPTNHLDLIYQKQIFELIAQWVKEPGRAVISVVHDLSLAKAFGTHALLMNKGKVEAYGKTEDVLRRELLCDVYRLDVYDWMEKMYSQWKG